MVIRTSLVTLLCRGATIRLYSRASMDKLNTTAPYIIVETKKPLLKDGKEQLKSYTNATGAPIAVWTNGQQISCYNRKDPNYFEQLSDIPKASEKLSDILMFGRVLCGYSTQAMRQFVCNVILISN